VSIRAYVLLVVEAGEDVAEGGSVVVTVILPYESNGYGVTE
jgi:hypothetical protein